MDVLFVTSVSVIARDPAAGRRLFVDALGLPLERMGGDYFASERIEGSKHFGVWPLTEAAEACFGAPEWPADRPVPQVSIEFELADGDAVAAGAAELAAAGFPLLHEARTEPWGQTVARLQTPEGVVVGLSYAPSLH
jgi:catechol 2,3-dioxygenase-like lactoylglutathione lyase family enzyme